MKKLQGNKSLKMKQNSKNKAKRGQDNVREMLRNQQMILKLKTKNHLLNSVINLQNIANFLRKRLME